MQQAFLNLLTSEDAASTVEYAALLALILVVIIMAVVQVGQQSMSIFNTVGNSVGSASS